jgi:hypothetical protein
MKINADESIELEAVFAKAAPKWAPGAEVIAPYHTAAVMDCDLLQDIAKTSAHLVTVSEEGGIVVVNLRTMKTTFKFSDSAAINAVCFRDIESDIITAGSSPSAQLKLWDLKTPKGVVSEFQDPGVGVEYYSLAKHSARPYTIAAGTNTGRIALWDIRKSTSEGLQYLEHEGMHAETGMPLGEPTATCLLSLPAVLLPFSLLFVWFSHRAPVLSRALTECRNGRTYAVLGGTINRLYEGPYAVLGGTINRLYEGSE